MSAAYAAVEVKRVRVEVDNETISNYERLANDYLEMARGVTGDPAKAQLPCPTSAPATPHTRVA